MTILQQAKALVNQNFADNGFDSNIQYSDDTFERIASAIDVSDNVGSNHQPVDLTDGEWCYQIVLADTGEFCEVSQDEFYKNADGIHSKDEVSPPVIRDTEPSEPSGNRQAITNFSRSALRNLKKKMSKINKNAEKPLFQTLTVADDCNLDYEGLKRAISNYQKALKRNYPEISGLWVMELKPRLSGKYQGQLKPHFHLILYGFERYVKRGFREIVVYKEFCRFCYTTWSRLLGVSSRVTTEYARKAHAASAYVSKYASKGLDEDTQQQLVDEEISIGRFYGFFNEQLIPWAEKVVMACSGRLGRTLMSIARDKLNIDKLEQELGLPLWFSRLTMFVDTEMLIQWMMEKYPSEFMVVDVASF